MQIVINIEKKHFYVIIAVVCLFGGSLVLAYSSGGTGGTPNQMGHSFDEVAGGTMNLGAVNCNAYNTGDCDGQIPGLVIQAQPETGASILELKDLSPSIPGGDALHVEGNAIFKDGQVAMLDLVQGVGSGTYQLCVIRSYDETNGAIVRC